MATSDQGFPHVPQSGLPEKLAWPSTSCSTRDVRVGFIVLEYSMRTYFVAPVKIWGYYIAYRKADDKAFLLSSRRDALRHLSRTRRFLAGWSARFRYGVDLCDFLGSVCHVIAMAIPHGDGVRY